MNRRRKLDNLLAFLLSLSSSFLIRNHGSLPIKDRATVVLGLEANPYTRSMYALDIIGKSSPTAVGIGVKYVLEEANVHD